jgi:hypothetical protein
MLPGSATLKVCNRGPLGTNTADGLDVSGGSIVFELLALLPLLALRVSLDSAELA